MGMVQQKIKDAGGIYSDPEIDCPRLVETCINHVFTGGMALLIALPTWPWEGGRKGWQEETT